MVDNRLPSRIIAAGQEPEKSKVTCYSKFHMINVINEALTQDESTRLKLEGSPFGMLLKLPSMPKFGAQFVHYLLCNQLETKKQHELWFVFGGKPWRFSLKEFHTVTGLCCGKLPDKGKSVAIKDDYWDALFGTEGPITVNWIIRRFQDGKVKTPELRIRYACLVLAEGILCPTSSATPISIESVRLLKDVDKFLSYPWGRKSFDMLLQSIKLNKVDNLVEGYSLAIQGFVYALQLVALEAIPTIHIPFRSSNYRLMAENTKVRVVPYIRCKSTIEENDFSWSEDEEDESVDYLVELVEKNHSFSVDMWDVQSEKEASDKKEIATMVAQVVQVQYQIDFSIKVLKAMIVCISEFDFEAKFEELMKAVRCRHGIPSLTDDIMAERKRKGKDQARESDRLDHVNESNMAKESRRIMCKESNKRPSNAETFTHSNTMKIGNLRRDSRKEQFPKTKRKLILRDEDKLSEAIPASSTSDDGRKGCRRELSSFIDSVHEKFTTSNYMKFLGYLGLFSKKIIDLPTLQSSVDDFIQGYPDLMNAFRDFRVWCEKNEGLLSGILVKKMTTPTKRKKLESRWSPAKPSAESAPRIDISVGVGVNSGDVLQPQTLLTTTQVPIKDSANHHTLRFPSQEGRMQSCSMLTDAAPNTVVMAKRQKLSNANTNTSIQNGLNGVGARLMAGF